MNTQLTPNLIHRLKHAAATSISIFIIASHFQPTLSAGACQQSQYIATQAWDCNCRPTGPVFGPVSCGNGRNTDPYYTCIGGRSVGYSLCLDPFQKIGTEWDCKVATSWNATIACSGLAAAAVAACLSTAAYAGVLCLASVGAYVSQCSGCTPVTCVKVNESNVNGRIISVINGLCPNSGNTGQ